MKNKGEGGQIWKGYVFFTIGSLIAVAQREWIFTSLIQGHPITNFLKAVLHYMLQSLTC